MPSLFSKFRHRKSASQSSNNSDTSNPSSPRSSSNIPRNSQGLPQTPTTATTHDSSPARASTDQGGRRSEDVFGGSGGNRRLPVPTGQDLSGATGGHGVTQSGRDGQGLEGRVKEGEVVVIGKQPSDNHFPLHASGTGTRDDTGHTRPFVDESQRPDLPTTTSNANNPIPVPTSQNSGSTHYVPQDAIGTSGATEDLLRKPLPAVPKVTTPSATVHGSDADPLHHGPNASQGTQGGRDGTFGHLAVDTAGLTGTKTRRLSESSGGPTVPPRSPQRASISEASAGGPHQHHERIRSPPLPHVASVDRSNLQREEEERPGLIGSSSRAPREGEQAAVTGDYPRVGDIPALREQSSGRASPGGISRRKGDKDAFVEIPKRDSSLKLSEDTELKALMEGGTGVSSRASISEGRQVRSSDTQVGGVTSAGQFQQDEDLSNRVTNMSLEQQGSEALPGLKEQRKELIVSLVEGSVSRAGQRETLTEEGRDVFRKAGMGKLLDREGTVDMRSKVLDPVVKETIFPKEHTEYTTVINRCIHKTHYIPLIQPIHDPDPVVLATRHRIFSAEDGQWHEVIGDAAAIEILGRDTFLNGPQERREIRKPALPGLEEMDDEAIRMSQEAGLYYSASSGSAAYTNTSMLATGGEREFRQDKQVQVPIRGEDVAHDGIGIGGGTGRVLEREYKVGDEGGDWQEVATYVGLENGVAGLRLGGNDASASKEDKNVGLAI
ncbi:hypothetical protein I316_00797 [Kwoniella heveanensis BCC8398]|uniref:Uncharacterized protein n=1 Tax=Kwoniella heveanensis BCC8398 TaxID=1296120 RepID=A0A1B9H334_9TREE|nr:hypothetical protein I316_00797 [Kwoniella heveanensis BCC8398]